ncbi:MAG: carbohydrate kinase family protein [Sulfolobales archaeon]
MSSEKSLDVVTVGHALVDIRIRVESFPQADQESSVLEQKWGAGGSAVNTAIGVRRLGFKSGIIAKIGFDNFGRIIVDELLREEVDTRGLRVSWGKTGFTVVAIDSSGEVIMYGFKGSAEELEPEEIDEEIIARSKHMHIASLRIDTSLRAIEIAKKYDLSVSWDPGRVLSKKGVDSLRRILEQVDIVMLNSLEAYYMTGEKDFKKAAEIIRSVGPRIVLVKLGGEGVYVSSRDLQEHIPALRVERVVDTTGAGDAFAAGFICGVLRGYSLRKAIIYANATAALKISRLGSYEVPKHEEVINFIWDRLGSI